MFLPKPLTVENRDACSTGFFTYAERAIKMCLERCGPKIKTKLTGYQEITR